MAYSYAFSMILSAFLLFQIQPMIGKYILPWFGGTPTVWSAVLLFFQALLTGGYAYAYWLLGRVRGRLPAIIHLIMIGVSLGILLAAALIWRSPITPDASWRPQGSDLPIWEIFKVLAVSVGIPYFILSSNSTLVQAWFNRNDQNRTPYHLYALSNAGSLVALISYPFIFEPNLTLQVQGYLWSAGYVVFAISTAFLAVRTYRQIQSDDVQPERDSNQPEESERPSWRRHVLWIGLAACATTLLISVTNQITQEVAVIPFLWVLPLSIYLLTFILAFAGGYGYSRRLYLIAFFIIGAVSIWMPVKWPPFSITVQILIDTVLLFICCMICHNELFKLRPHPRHLPSFYLMISAGGAMGGIFVTLIAPFLFSSGFWELEWGIIACGALLTLIMQSERTPVQPKPRGKARQRVVQEDRRFKPVVIVSSFLLLLLSGFAVLTIQAFSSDTRMATRNFYGVLRVWEINADKPKLRAFELTHGKTVHGFQFDADILRVLPTTYYSENSGVGLSILNHPARPGNLRIGALGLGVGVIAAYGEPGDVFQFYEINPDVIRIAQGEGGYFSFLTDSRATIRVIPGDARVSLERELVGDGSQNFDLMVLDAFSGDALPLHLLTKQAFEIYLKHLKPDGIMAINVSNRYFNLDQEIYRLADEFDLGTVLIEDVGDSVQSFDSAWMLLTRNRDFLKLPAIASRSTPRLPVSNVPVWTDDYSNLLQILK